METVKILDYVEHKTAKWQGIIYETQSGEKRVCNAHFDWELTVDREAALDKNVDVDIPLFLARAYGDAEENELFRKLFSGNMNPALFNLLRENLEKELGVEGAKQAIEAKFPEI